MVKKERVTKSGVDKTIRGLNKWRSISIKCKKCGFVYHIRTEEPEAFDKFNPIRKGKSAKKPTKYICLICRMFKDYEWYRDKETEVVYKPV